MCRCQLVLDPTDLDSESVVGDECHIVSSAKNGPRHDPSYPAIEFDDLPNLLLLCRVHHKLIDDQSETYTAELVRAIKIGHEQWVENRLKEKTEIPPVRISRRRSEIPIQLPVIESGKELLNLAVDCHGAYNDYSDDLTHDETELIGGFIQNVSDWADLAGGFEPIDRVRAAKALDDEIKILREQGFLVFAAVERQQMEGGIGGKSSFRVLHLTVKRRSDPGVVTAEA